MASSSSGNLLHLICIVNQLHRLALPQSNYSVPPGMSVSQIAVIALLHYTQEHELYQRDLEGILRLRRSTVSSLLTTLEKKDMLRRVSVSHDARLNKLELTEAGSALGDTVQDYLSYADHVMVQGLSAEELSGLTATLLKIQQNLDRAEA